MAIQTIPAPTAGGVVPKYQKFTSSGTFTLPTGYGVSKPLLVTVQVIGGGGAGGYTGTKSLTAVGMRNESSGGTTNWAGTFTANFGGGPGGSGGIAQSQLYLTENLTITIGAQATRQLATAIPDTLPANDGTRFGVDSSWNRSYEPSQKASTGGTSTAGSISAAGGTGGGTASYLDFADGNSLSFSSAGSGSAGTGGSPAGTNGNASPGLGQIAPGTYGATAIFGSFGVGGKNDDGATPTGVEGTGGGSNSTAAPGAVILTWWE